MAKGANFNKTDHNESLTEEILPARARGLNFFGPKGVIAGSVGWQTAPKSISRCFLPKNA